jgi:hypothetical protein
MEKEKLVLPVEEACWIINSDHENFDVVREKIVSRSRWAIRCEIIVKRLSDGKFFKSHYSVGATEYQDERPWQNDDEALFDEVFPVEKTILVYE